MKQVCVPLHLQDSLDNKEKRRVAKIPSNPIFLVEPAEVPVYPTILVDTMDKRTETKVPINGIIHMEFEKRKGTKISGNPITCVETVEKREDSQFPYNPMILEEPVETGTETQIPCNPIILVNDILVEDM